MPLRIYNSLTKQKEEFKPLNPPEVRMYVCGPTVYDEPHIGHLRSAYVFDVMRRYLEYSSYKVKFVRNVTDVDDKIIEKARSESLNASDLVTSTKLVSEKYLNLYHEDLKKLGILEPTVEPRAMTHIPQMIALIKTLIEKGAAYPQGGDVYYNVNNFSDYGKLSKQKIESMLEGVRNEPNENKKSPLDFALWKKSKEGEPAWDSPWGKGRPGWHIECSAMSREHLGETLDIHGGGRDLIFPHHENEIAQSEASTGKKFANTWIHHGLITVNEQKMSKSLKNFITLKQVAEKSSNGIEELKLLFLGTHYSAPLDYSSEKMEMVKAIRSRFALFLQKAESCNAKSSSNSTLRKFDTNFDEAMNDDFNTPLAIAVMHELVDYAYAENQPSVFASAADLFITKATLLGLSFASTVDETLKVFIEGQIKKREEAKKNKDFKLADEIRKDLLVKYKVSLMDSPSGKTSWIQD